MNQKLKWLRDSLSRNNMQGMIISNPISIKYLTGIDAEGLLLLTRKENIYLTDGRYIESVNTVLTIDDEIIVNDVRNISSDEYENLFSFCENVGFEEKHLTYSKYKEYMCKYKINNFEETDDIIERQRLKKDLDEIENIKKACQITDECFLHLLNYIKIGKTEKEIALEIERFFKLNGADGVSFDPIVASGSNSSMPHAVPTYKKIVAGDIIILDFGCKYKVYCSDMTRTVFVGYVPKEVKPVYDLVLKNQLQILEEIRDGANARILYTMVEGDFKINNYSLIHALGHGVGLEIHENPIIGKTDFILKENQVITNEPGIYLPGDFGVRIEDTVLITKSGAMPLTKSDKEYTIIKGY